MSADPAEPRFRSVLKRARSRLPKQVRIENPVLAYLACGFAATAIVALLSCGVILAIRSIQVPNILDLLIFFVSGTFAWIAISVGGILVAWPFIASATWIGRGLRVESFAYYFVAGGVTMAGLVFSVFGTPEIPDPNFFGANTFSWAVGPACGASWGGCWWLIHRRWKVRRTTDPEIFA